MAEADVGNRLDAVESVSGAYGYVGKLQHCQVVLVVAAGVKLDGLARLFFNIFAKSGDHSCLGGVRCLKFKIFRARFARFEAVGPGLFSEDAEFIKLCLVAADNYLIPISDREPFFLGKIEYLCGSNPFKIVIDRGTTLALTWGGKETLLNRNSRARPIP